MDRNTWIGFFLIAVIIVGFSLLTRPSKEEIAERQRVNDSIALVQQLNAQAEAISQQLATEQPQPEAIAQAEQKAEETMTVLENSKMRLFLSNYGGRIARAELKEYKAYGDIVNNLCLFRGDEADMTFTLVTANNRILSTHNLVFEPIIENDSVIRMRLKTEDPDAWLDFVYTLPADEYMLRFDIAAHNMNNVLAQNMSTMEMQWRQKIVQQERGRKFEERYAQLQYMLVGGDMEKLSESKSDTKKESARIKWIGYKDQFFSTVLIADDAFTSTVLESTPMDKYSHYIKEYKTETSVNFDLSGKQVTGFRMYLGPNHYNTLKAYDDGLSRDERLRLKELVPLGWKIVSWINKALVIPMFDWFSSWGLHIGIVILLMTIVIKLIILPFVFASYRSSAKMRVLRPQIDAINEKYPPEKMQERQQATMALYRRAGVNPMSGCLPMLFQFPVLMAMFWFFPTAIELRGKSLWWADDLSAYDSILTWGFNIPLLGDHLSLFCLLMTVANFGYTYVTMQQQATDPNMKFMKYMMYAMPLMFLFIFNDYAAGLSYYYLLSLGITILQTMVFRWSIDDKKLLAQMEANAKKKEGKPKSGLMARLEKLQQEQQRMAREQAKAQAKKYK